MIGVKLVTAIALILILSSGWAYSGDDPWFSTAEEIANAYKYQVRFGSRLRDPLNPKPCSFGRDEFAASYRGKEISVPCRFIAETKRQLRGLIESGAVKYFFPLDVGSGDFAIPVDLWEAEYKMLPVDELIPKLLHEVKLVAVYHTAGHLFPTPSGGDAAISLWQQRRTVAGYYDGRPNEVLRKKTPMDLYDEPEGLIRLSGFTMMEHHLGELVILAGETVVVLDISLDNEQAVPNAPRALHVSAITD